MAKTEKTCTVCGATFTGGAGAMYCPTCRRTRKAELERERRENGSKRKIGSTDICEKCGAEYTVKGALQKYCDACRPERKPPKAPPKIEIVPTTKKRTQRKPRIVKCANCGNEFSTTGNHVVYCPDCRPEIRSVYREHSEKKRDKVGTKYIGAETTCTKCGKQFVVTKINQKFCHDCREARDAAKPKNECEKRRCVVCGNEIPTGRGYWHALTCSPECRRKRRIKYDEGRDWSAHAKSKNPLFISTSAEMRDRVFAEAKSKGYTVSRYVRDLIQKEFDALDKERNDKPE